MSGLRSLLEGENRREFLTMAVRLAEEAQGDFLLDTMRTTIRLTSAGLPVSRSLGRARALELIRPIRQHDDDTDEQSEENWSRVRVLSEGESEDSNRPSVLYLGPNSFREQVWDIRMKYLFPDLYSALESEAEIYMLVPEPPDHARASLLEFARRYRVQLFRFVPVPGMPRSVSWILAAGELIEKLGGVDVVTNVQGHTLFGLVAAHLRRVADFRSVVRVAGDEIMARIDLNAIKRRSDLLEQVLTEIYIANQADEVIVMSDWEAQRLQSIVEEDGKRVTICHRGVDIEMFRPDVSFGKYSSLREDSAATILYLGRKSAEKGYAKVASYAQALFRDGAEAKFAFAGPGFEIGADENRIELGFAHPDDLPSLLAAVDAIVLLSTTESLGQVILEALACGRLCFVEYRKYQDMFEGCPGIVMLPPEPDLAIARIVETLATRGDQLVRRIRRYAEQNLDHRKQKQLYKSIILSEAVRERVQLIA